MAHIPAPPLQQNALLNKLVEVLECVLPEQQQSDMFHLLWAPSPLPTAVTGAYHLAVNFRGTTRQRAGRIAVEEPQQLQQAQQLSAQLQLKQRRKQSFKVFLQSAKGSLLHKLRLQVGDDAYVADALSILGSTDRTAPIQLTKLDLQLQHNPLGVSLQAPLAALTSLRHLVLTAPDSTDLQLGNISSLSNLTELKTNLDNPHSLNPLPSSLQVLHVEWRHGLAPDAVIKLGHLQQLRELRFIGWPDCSLTTGWSLPASLTRLQAASVRTTLPLITAAALKELALASIHQSNNSALRALSEFSSLQRLQFSYQEPTTACIADWTLLASKLEVLVLRFSDTTPDDQATILTALQQLSNLTYLSLTACSTLAVTLTGLSRLCALELGLELSMAAVLNADMHSDMHSQWLESLAHLPKLERLALIHYPCTARVVDTIRGTAPHG